MAEHGTTEKGILLKKDAKVFRFNSFRAQLKIHSELESPRLGGEFADGLGALRVRDDGGARVRRLRAEKGGGREGSVSYAYSCGAAFSCGDQPIQSDSDE